MAAKLTGRSGTLRGAVRTIARITSWEMLRVKCLLCVGEVQCISKRGIAPGRHRRMTLRSGRLRAEMTDVTVMNPRSLIDGTLVFTFQAQLNRVTSD